MYKTHRFSALTGHLPSREGDSRQRLLASLVTFSCRLGHHGLLCCAKHQESHIRNGLLGSKAPPAPVPGTDKQTPASGASAARAQLHAWLNGVSAGGSSGAPGLQPTPPDPCPFSDHRQRLFLPSALSRAPLKQSKASAPSPHRFCPLLPAGAAAQPLSTISQRSEKVFFQRKATPELPAASALPVPPPLNPGSSDSSQNVSVLPARPAPASPERAVASMSFGEALRGGNLSLSTPGSAMRSSGTERVINNNEKLGLPWICCSIYNVHLSPSPRPREIRTPFSALAWGVIFKRDAVTAGGDGRGRRVAAPTMG
ncbi:uncharacterized protein [Patagioenas fasciata]|uniref:uncharacterized protein n=1 Tax=Patagioenas fasciata TaxID=372321 RepID=UPI003A98FA55